MNRIRVSDRWQFAWAIAAVGVAARLVTFFDQGGRVLRQFPSEDGYLMLTMARNIALGHGMSTAAGTIPTNGTQPLATYLWAACFWAAGGAREAGVTLVLLLEVLISGAAAWLLYRLGRRAFAHRPGGGAIAALAAALWFASPLGVVHSMNCLESGLYVLAILGVLLAVLAQPGVRGEGPSLGRWAGIGLLLGVAFWARNDAVLLCVAVGLAHLGNALPAWRGPPGWRIGELAVAAAATLVVAAPWLVANQLGFGSVVPISGQAESLHVVLGQNLARVPASLFEHVSLVGLIPSSLETHPGAVAICSLALLAAATGIGVRASRWSPEERTLLVIGSGFVALLAAFYGFFFGAGYFMSRYLFAASPFTSLLAAGALATAWRSDAARRRPRLRLAGALAAAALLLGLHVRIYARGSEHLHFQVVDWVQENVPSEVWVAAVQSGTLGFFHDRTLNLDGKVNPEALRARKQGRIPAYVLEKDVQYVVDWAGLADWARLPDLEPHFELVLRDEARNLAVLRRRSARRHDAGARLQ
jgi:hypothetical protein